ncbi:hypothetical protein Q9966_011801 [Columba livia]|nr:hypothetical protein Q9966_011801 [Columba livia]
MCQLQSPHGCAVLKFMLGAAGGAGGGLLLCCSIVGCCVSGEAETNAWSGACRSVMWLRLQRDLKPHTLSPFSKILPWHPAGQNRRIKPPPCSFCIRLLLFLSTELRGRPCVYFHIVSPTHQLEQAMNPHHLNLESFLFPFFNSVCLCWKVM